MRKKTTIKVCFCFLDKAVWFINNSWLLPYWLLNSKIKNKDDTTNDDEHFILERRTTIDNLSLRKPLFVRVWTLSDFKFQYRLMRIFYV